MALRTPLSVTPHLYMGDSTGRPLDMGTVYFGEQDKDPEFYPINLFSDDALTLPLAQPVHTKGGYLYDKGDMVEPHAKEIIYSVKVLDSYGRKVFYKGAMMRNSWNDDVIQQISAALVSTAEEAAQIATDVAKEIADKAVISSGFVTIDSFELGATLTQRNQALRHAADGRLYRWAGDLPKTVPVGSTPTTSGGIGANAWLEVSDTVLRQQLSNNKGVALVKGAVIVVDSIEDMQTYSSPVGTVFRLSDERRWGKFKVVAGDYSAKVLADTNNGIYVPLFDDPTGSIKVAKRVIKDTVRLEWFDLDTSGTSLVEPIIQFAVEETPDYGYLTCEGLTGTLLVDTSNTDALCAIDINKPITFVGSKSCLIKLKPFSTSWTTTNLLGRVVRLSHNDAIADGLYVDANGNNHYSFNADGSKWWETGETLQRPVNGIQITTVGIDGYNNNPNLTGNIIKNCHVWDALAGCSALGSLGRAGDSDRFKDNNYMLDNSLIVEPLLINNTTYRCRGNGFLFGGGVVGGIMRNNTTIDNMYQSYRFYSTIADCVMENNHAYTDYDRIALGFNDTDNGFYRTNKKSDSAYYITRLGYTIGSGWGGLMRNTMRNNTASFKTNNPVTDIINGTDALSVFSLDDASETLVENNSCLNAPAIGLVVVSREATSSSVVIRNTFTNCRDQGASISGYNNTVEDNIFDGCCEVQPSNYIGSIILAGINSKFINNKIIRRVYKKIYPLEVRGDAELFISGTQLIGNGFSLSMALKNNMISTSAIVHGDDFGYKLTMLNGWESLSEDEHPKAYIEPDGTVIIYGGRFKRGAATSDVLASLPVSYSPKGDRVFGVATQVTESGTSLVGMTFPILIYREGTSTLIKANDRDASTKLTWGTFIITYKADFSY